MKVFTIANGNTFSESLFSDVANPKELLDSMQAGTLEPEVAFLNASLIPDIFSVLAAAHKTLVSKSRDRLTTRALHSELDYNISGCKHMKAVEKLISGKEIDLEELEIRANQTQIQKHYKISGGELGIYSLGDAIVCRIAARDAL